MSATGLPVFDTTIHKTNDWINEVAQELRWDDKHRAFQGLRVDVTHMLPPAMAELWPQTVHA
ncbi:hypothetical protein PN462_20815 [Spirulina sp. CS-785/01]|uniref:hypothetical protein n=1 Tax=Spirulina sp. CS-785/01 TaxID=3021716 RepID=UPI00232E1996|nr:hypothetical protein [Spirulina sp. CS-785/01]MDB9315567.1 hypothetical protein [Spirulina sp. CS-785/01]